MYTIYKLYRGVYIYTHTHTHAYRHTFDFFLRKAVSGFNFRAFQQPISSICRSSFRSLKLRFWMAARPCLWQQWLMVHGSFSVRLITQHDSASKNGMHLSVHKLIFMYIHVDTYRFIFLFQHRLEYVWISLAHKKKVWGKLFTDRNWTTPQGGTRPSCEVRLWTGGFSRGFFGVKNVDCPLSNQQVFWRWKSLSPRFLLWASQMILCCR